MKKRIFALFLSITLLLSTVVTSVNAEGVNNFTVKVSDTTATAGDNRVAVDILLENNPGIAGFSFCVNYNTEKLVLVESKINIEGGYRVIAQPTGYGVNLAWTGPSGYSKDGKIATLYFNIPKDLTASEGNIDIVYRTGYDSFYDSHEHDIAVNTVNGKISIAALKESDIPSVNIGSVSATFGDTDIVVPITVNNNAGFSGFSFCVNYDTSRLILEDTKILLEGGYKVIGHPEGYAVNIAWTSTDAYIQDGTIAELHFSLKDNANSGKAYINTAFRDGYDSFYNFVNGTEQDIAFDAFSGYVDINNHNFGDWVVTIPATCTATGLKTRTCTDCSKTETVVIPKVAHEYIAVITAPTCTVKGYTTHTCKNCPDYYIDTYVDMIDHTPGEWEQSIAPGCEAKGEEIQKCSVCKTTINTRPVDETGHDFDDWYVAIEAKFNEDGEQRRNCKNCDHFEANRIPKLSESHVCDFTGTEEIIEDATCTENGSKKIYCFEEECGNFEIVEIVAQGHKYGEWYTTLEPTFNEDGEQRRDCNNCNHYETEKLPKLSEGHVCSYTGIEEIIDESTCAQSGSKKVYCSNPSCKKFITVTVDPKPHTGGTWEVSVEATCTDKGIEVIKCISCDTELQSRSIDALGHSWDSGVVIKQPDCLNEGIKTFYCSNCTDTKNEPIAANGHTEGEWIITNSASCTVAGLKEKRCAVCNSLIATEIVPATGHSLGNWYEYKKAEFYTDGEERKDCSNCDYYESRRIPKLSEGHTCSYTGTEEIISNPTCTQVGSKKVYCNNSDCGNYIIAYIEPTGHTEGEWKVVKEATCTVAGSKEKRCVACDSLIDTSTILATGHSLGDWYEYKKAEFHTDGEERKDCSICDYYESRRIPKLSEGHTCSYTGIEEIISNPTCTQSGSMKVYCNDTACGNYITLHIEPTGHTEGEWKVAKKATCTVAGSKEKNCTICNTLIAIESIAATGHSLGNWYEYKKADFNTDGEERKDCSNCDYYESRRIPKLSESHICSYTGIEEIISNPTCTQSGSKKVYCNNPDCGSYITVYIEPTNHTEGEWKLVKEATCTVAGSKEKRCTRCNAPIFTETIPSTGHTLGNWYEYKKAEFHTDGEERKDCVNCDYYESRRIPKLSEGHTCAFIGNEEITLYPTCTQSGSMKVYCSNSDCGNYTIIYIDPTGHVEGEWNITNEATCTTSGSKEKRCTLCKALIATEIILYTGHSYGSWETTQSATCTNPGTEVIKCITCKVVLQSREIAATGHNWNDGVITTQPSHITFGEKTYTCNNCSVTKTEQVAKITEHTYSGWVKVDGDNHKRTCECGSVEIQSHTWDEGVITKQADCLNEGEKTFTCSVCSAKVIELIPTVDHIFSEYIYNNDATEEADGTQTRACTVCGYSETITADGTKLEKVLLDTSTMFTDIKATAWYKQYIDYSVTYGILSGAGNGKMLPNKTMTRAEFVQVLANLAGVDTSNKNIKTGFTDVKSGAWYAPAVKWASENGIVSGVGNGKFSPNANITREQMCSMLVRYVENHLGITLESSVGKKTFADDNKISSWAKDAVYKCQQAGLVNGVSETMFAPKDNATRASVATIMSKFHEQYLRG